MTTNQSDFVFIGIKSVKQGSGFLNYLHLLQNDDINMTYFSNAANLFHIKGLDRKGDRQEIFQTEMDHSKIFRNFFSPHLLATRIMFFKVIFIF